MLKFLRRHLSTMLVALIMAAVTSAGPAIAHGVRHALFAHNSDKVDGKHAVGSSATLQKRKGKLVATNPTTGLLPNSIIAKAPDADKLDGQDSSAFLGATAKAADSDNLDGQDSSAFLGATAKAADSDNLDGIDSTGFVRGNGKVLRASLALTPGSAQLVLAEPLPTPSPSIRVTYTCPADITNTGVVRIINVGDDTINVFTDDGGTNPGYGQLVTNQASDHVATATGEHITFQVQGIGMATVELFSVHRSSDNTCHVQVQAVYAH